MRAPNITSNPCAKTSGVATVSSATNATIREAQKVTIDAERMKESNFIGESKIAESAKRVNPESFRLRGKFRVVGYSEFRLKCGQCTSQRKARVRRMLAT